ncbi:MAG: DUF2249 domain-containing protein [Sulfuricellaceae bacterium]
MAEELLLDVRGLEPPQPLEQALEASSRLAPGQRLRMIHHREPCLLYPLLEKRGFCRRTASVTDERFELLIWRKGDVAAEAEAEAVLG